jgi:hypothetical protein
MNPSWKDDHLDRILRDVMQSRPEHQPIQNLALRAVQRVNQQEAILLRTKKFRRHSWWHQLVSLAAIAVIGVAVWFAADLIVLHAAYDSSAIAADGSSESAANAVDQPDLVQAVNSDEIMFIALGTLLIVAVVIAVHRALSSEQYSLSAGGTGGRRLGWV